MFWYTFIIVLHLEQQLKFPDFERMDFKLYQTRVSDLIMKFNFKKQTFVATEFYLKKYSTKNYIFVLTETEAVQKHETKSIKLSEVNFSVQFPKLILEPT